MGKMGESMIKVSSFERFAEAIVPGIRTSWISEDGRETEHIFQCQKDALINTPNELVRCKDCINRGNPKKCLVAYIGDVKSVPYFYVDNNGEFYCADGKRKE